ncbi:DNA-binding transcriptional LysR family regulator [Actinoplanes lutulentus]|uniref:DNA-binding transcriptional LysR family regulator n=1 Tax=Actinoplanes lutulentus TaxID=1287878 RepID=A0A327Z1H0_9ACTN|nr:LysR family transcriptional regulator [Actinoplanes lutulentus]MBB2943323.1 DNA-binding transcriptional LysR family regulator [Actinoplanes lutulentus]RAK28382.1 DNA-binding transcriptional LysR family regulator [Actinoplanes lutulentus]
MFHTRDLRYFVAVAEHLHITRAAASLFVTQPALSKQIASLERSLGAPLFIRLHEGVALTPAGEALLPYARQIVELEEQATNDVLQAARSADKMTIGFWVSPANEVLSPAISAFCARQPSVRLRLRRADWSEPGAGVVGRRADVGLLETPHDRPVRGLRSHRVAVEDVVVAMASTHHLAQRQQLAPADLTDETVFVLPKEAKMLSGFRFAPTGAHRLANLEYVTTIDETVEGIVTGLGVCIVTPSLAAAHPHPGMVTVPLSDAEPGDYWVVWRPEDERKPEIQDLVACLISSAETWFVSLR